MLLLHMLHGSEKKMALECDTVQSGGNLPPF